jgi:hypothetical protein
MSVHIGGANSYLQRVTGDIVSSYQWVNDEPAMILWPKIPKTNAGAFVLCLSSAHKYRDVRYLVAQAAKAAAFMGMEAHSFTVKRIADIILDGIPDLVKMPPQPVAKKQDHGVPVGELAIKVDGQTVHEQEVTAP